MCSIILGLCCKDTIPELVKQLELLGVVDPPEENMCLLFGERTQCDWPSSYLGAR